MGDPVFATRLNTTLLKPGATMEASKYMTSSIRKILESFTLIDPYVQAVLLQSVIHISASDFDGIRPEYSELIVLARDSEDEWVRRKAAEFQHFPQLTIDEDITEFDFSGVFSEKPMALPTISPAASGHRDAVHFTLRQMVKRPSDGLPPPKLAPQAPAPRPPPPPMERSVPPALPNLAARPVPFQHAYPPPPQERSEKATSNKPKKKLVTLDELQAEREAEFRPDTRRRK
jgi:hypothetical protein